MVLSPERNMAELGFGSAERLQECALGEKDSKQECGCWLLSMSLALNVCLGLPPNPGCSVFLKQCLRTAFLGLCPTLRLSTLSGPFLPALWLKLPLTDASDVQILLFNSTLGQTLRYHVRILQVTGSRQLRGDPVSGPYTITVPVCPPGIQKRCPGDWNHFALLSLITTS